MRNVGSSRSRPARSRRRVASSAAERELVQPKRAREWALAQHADPLGRAQHDAGLGAPEQLVPREADQIDAARQPRRSEALGREPVRAQVDERGAAEIVHDGDVVTVPDPHQLGEVYLCHEAAELEVGAVHLQDGARARADGALVVSGVGTIRRAHLDQAHARLAQDLRHPEGAADLDQLAARDDHLAAARERREREQDGGGAVVEGERVLGARQQSQQLRDPGAALAPLAALEVELECAVARRRPRPRRRPPLGAARSGRGWCGGPPRSRSRPEAGAAGRAPLPPRGLRLPDRPAVAPRSMAYRAAATARRAPRRSAQRGSSGRACSSCRTSRSTDGSSRRGSLGISLLCSLHARREAPQRGFVVSRPVVLTSAPRSRMFRRRFCLGPTLDPPGASTPGSLPEGGRGGPGGSIEDRPDPEKMAWGADLRRGMRGALRRRIRTATGRFSDLFHEQSGRLLGTSTRAPVSPCLPPGAAAPA